MTERATFRCAHYEFSLEGPPAVVERMRSAFGDLVVGDFTDDCDKQIAAHWQIEEVDDRLVVKIDDLAQFRAHSPIGLIHQAVPWLTRKALDDRPDALHLHAMAVLDSGSALIAAGPSGAGKSTLCAAALNAGAAYMTDEAVGIDPDTLTGHGYRKPIVVKRRSFAPVTQLTGLEPPADTGDAWEIPASQIGALAPDEPQPVSTLVSYRYAVDGPTAVGPIHRATLVHALLSDALDAGRFGPQAVVVAARLAAQATCLHASGSDTTAVVSGLHAWHRRPVEPGTLQILGPADAGRSPRRSDKITSVVIDGRCVLYDSAAQRAIELDEAAGIWWRLLDGSPVDEIVADVAEATASDRSEIRVVASRFVDEFTTLRLVDVD